MKPFTTYQLEKTEYYSGDNQFCLPIYLICSTKYDNKEVLGYRMSFILIDQGAGIAKVDDKQIPYVAPCIFCINEKEHIEIPISNENRIRVLLFHPEIINSVFNFNNIRKLPEDIALTVKQDCMLLYSFIDDRKKYAGKLSLGAVSYKKLSDIMDNIDLQIGKQETANWPCRSRSFVMELFFILEKLFDESGYPDEIITTKISDDFEPIISYLYLHYNEKLSVLDITEHFHISKAKMSKMFKENVGESFLNYINRLRIHMASIMLRDTYLPIQEIMYKVGFNDSVHFLRMFKRFMGSTPSAYRDDNHI